jgi:hypothetical protein
VLPPAFHDYKFQAQNSDSVLCRLLREQSSIFNSVRTGVGTRTVVCRECWNKQLKGNIRENNRHLKGGGSSSNTKENKSTPVKKVRFILRLILSIFLCLLSFYEFSRLVLLEKPSIVNFQGISP